MQKIAQRSSSIFLFIFLVLGIYIVDSKPTEAIIPVEIVADPVGWTEAVATAISTAQTVVNTAQTVYNTLEQVKMMIDAAKNLGKTFSTSQYNLLQQALNTLKQAQNQNQYLMLQQKYLGSNITNYIDKFIPTQGQWDNMTFAEQQQHLEDSAYQINDDLRNNVQRLASILDKKRIEQQINDVISEQAQNLKGNNEVATLQLMCHQLSTLQNILLDNKEIAGEMATSLNNMAIMENQERLNENANTSNALEDSMQFSTKSVPSLQQFYKKK